MHIVLLEPLGVSVQDIDRLSRPLRDAGHTFTAYDTVETDPAKLLERAGDAQALMLANHPLPGQVIRDCPHLRYISVAFVGIDHIGADACREKGIHVSNAAGYCTDAVAELTLGLALDCLRNISRCDAAVRDGKTKDGLLGHELAEKTVGILGTGAIGCRAAELFGAFHCKVLGYSRSIRQAALDAGVEYVSLDELLCRSDILSVHTPLTPDTRHLLNRERVARMKPGAILLNTARGPIVDEEAVAEALKSGRLAALGTDVFASEPPISRDHPFFTAPNVVATPHVAFATYESLRRRAEITFQNVISWLDGRIQNQML